MNQRKLIPGPPGPALGFSPLASPPCSGQLGLRSPGAQERPFPGHALPGHEPPETPGGPHALSMLGQSKWASPWPQGQHILFHLGVPSQLLLPDCSGKEGMEHPDAAHGTVVHALWWEEGWGDSLLPTPQDCPLCCQTLKTLPEAPSYSHSSGSAAGSEHPTLGCLAERLMHPIK